VLRDKRRGKWGQEFFHVDFEIAKSTIDQICTEVDQRPRPEPPAPAAPFTPPQAVPAPPVTPPPLGRQDSGSGVRAGGLRPNWIIGAGVVAVVLWWSYGQRSKTPPTPSSQGAPVSQLSQPSLGRVGVPDPQGSSTGTSSVASVGQSQSETADQSQKSGATSASRPEPLIATRPPSEVQVQPAPARRDIDLNGLNAAERRSIESTCRSDQLNNGPAAYNRCLTGQLAALQSAPRNVDLSALNAAERRSIESTCRSDQLNNGPAAYNRCLTRQLRQLSLVSQ
jgi:hypothetical protein